MYSLKELLEVGDYSRVTTTQTSIDPETGKISWDVSYKPDFNVIFKKLDDAIKSIQSVESEEKIKDPIIDKNVRELKAIRRSLENRVMEKYPEYLK